MSWKRANAAKWAEFPKMTRAWRRRLGFTQREAAARLGVPQRTVEGWELGRIPSYPQPMILAMSYIEWANSNRAPISSARKEASSPPRL